MHSLTIEPTGANDTGVCECCGHMSRCVWGLVHTPKQTLACYFVHWTLNGVRDHGANFDLIVGPWSDGASARDRVLVAMEYRLLESGPAFMVIDSNHRPAATSELVGQALSRDEVIGQPIAREAFDIVDTILAQDVRVAELINS